MGGNEDGIYMLSLAKTAIISAFSLLMSLYGGGATADEKVRPLIEGHIHYSHDAWEYIPADKAIEILREAGFEKALVSSSSDEGTQRLYALAPGLVVPLLRPYRARGETHSWKRDETVIPYMQERLRRYEYVGLGEFHAIGDDILLPVVRKVVEMGRDHKLILQVHVDARAIDNIFKIDPNARVLWAHAGFEEIDVIGEMLAKHRNLWADLAIRTVNEPDGKIIPRWRRLFLDFPDRFILGVDTYTPSQWDYVISYADEAQIWLNDLPTDVGDNIAFGNARRLLKSYKIQ